MPQMVRPISGVDFQPTDVVSYETPAYTNSGGTGDRTSQITATTTTTEFGGISLMINGNLAQEWFFLGEAITGREMKFDFHRKVIINEIHWVKGDAAASSQGIWQLQISDDGSNWTNVGATFDLCFAQPSDFYITTMSANVTPARYLRFFGISGSTLTAAQAEIEFKIGNPQ
jgi:hypothetical protein